MISMKLSTEVYFTSCQENLIFTCDESNMHHTLHELRIKTTL